MVFRAWVSGPGDPAAPTAINSHIFESFAVGFNSAISQNEVDGYPRAVEGASAGNCRSALVGVQSTRPEPRWDETEHTLPWLLLTLKTLS